MDGQRFDELARLAGRVSRRHALRVLGGSVLGGGLVVRRVSPAGAATCRARQQSCRGTDQCCGGASRKTKCARLSNLVAGLVCPPDLRCCGRNETLCQSTCDCCDGLFCSGGRCIPAESLP